MPDDFLAALVAGLKATTPVEAIAVLLGLAYVLLVARRSRWGWVAGGLSSALFAWLFFGARLPMQGLLQIYYVLMSVYGFIRWTRGGDDRPVERRPLHFHLLGIGASLAVALPIAHLLATETQAASPYLDAVTTIVSLFATWLIARMVLENWLYWIVVDCLQAVLFASQGLWFTALLFVAYLAIGTSGYLAWLRTWRRQATS